MLLNEIEAYHRDLSSLLNDPELRDAHTRSSFKMMLSIINKNVKELEGIIYQSTQPNFEEQFLKDDIVE